MLNLVRVESSNARSLLGADDGWSLRTHKPVVVESSGRMGCECVEAVQPKFGYYTRVEDLSSSYFYLGDCNKIGKCEGVGVRETVKCEWL
jgi:hypothetical protein